VDVGTASGSCGGTQLTASASYDQGLGAIKTLTDIHQEETTINYDGFGRIVEMFRPDPTTGKPPTLPSHSC
jgi:YD repeat-containing protein